MPCQAIITCQDLSKPSWLTAGPLRDPHFSVGTTEHQEILPVMHMTLVTSLDFNHKQIKQPSCPGVNPASWWGQCLFPILPRQAEWNLSPTHCGLFAFKLVFSHYRNLLSQLQFPFSPASAWKLHFLLESPSCLLPSRRQWDVLTCFHRGHQIACESCLNPRQAWHVFPRRRWRLGRDWRILAPAIAVRRPWGLHLLHLGLIFSFAKKKKEKNIDQVSMMIGAWNAEINKTHLPPPRSCLSSKGERKEYKKKN